jgi:hypothetical protein
VRSPNLDVSFRFCVFFNTVLFSAYLNISRGIQRVILRYDASQHICFRTFLDESSGRNFEGINVSAWAFRHFLKIGNSGLAKR